MSPYQSAVRIPLSWLKRIQKLAYTENCPHEEGVLIGESACGLRESFSKFVCHLKVYLTMKIITRKDVPKKVCGSNCTLQRLLSLEVRKAGVKFRQKMAFLDG